MMFRTLTLTVTALLALSAASFAQVTTTPPLLQESSENIVVYYHADQGTAGLANLPPDAEIYAHTGVITSNSTSPRDWKYAPVWGNNDPKYKMEYVSPNLWKLNIGDIRSYYGITDSGEHMEKLAFVFRNADGTVEGKGPNGTDIFADIYPEGLQVSLTSDNDGNIITAEKPTVTLTLSCSEMADLILMVNGTHIKSMPTTYQLTFPYTFNDEGNYTITGIAEKGGETVSTTLELVRPQSSPQADYPGGVPQMGAVRNADGSVTFCIAAPQKTSVMIVGSWNDYLNSSSGIMSYQDYQGDRYFWITIPDLVEGKDYIYYYVVDSSTKVGDPYARLVLDPYFDNSIPADVYPDMPKYPYDVANDVPMAVFNDNFGRYDWKVKNFKGAEPDELIIYELLLRDFTGTEGEALGNGNLRMAMEKIPYLKQLGVNAVELMPICEFNGNNSWGYNPNFYFAPDKAYGTPDDYKAFIDECHNNGIAVILDIVFNQTDWLHPWYRMYPVGSNPFYNATAPHAYSVLNDWNQGYPLVRRQFEDVLKYWLTEYNVDGFRFDLVKGLGNNESYSSVNATDRFNQSRIDNMRSLQLAMEQVKPGAYFINENLAGADEENAMAEYGQLNWANVNRQGIQFATGQKSDSGLERFYAPRDGRNIGSTVSYLESHDEQRLAYMQNTYGVTGIKGNLRNSMLRLGSAAAQMMMAPGAHMIWQFSELGNATNNKNSDNSNNVNPKTVRWSYFDKPERRGLYQSYAELIGLRRANPEMFDSQAEVNILCSASNWESGRTITISRNDKQLILAVNPNTSGDDLLIAAPFHTTNNEDYHILSKSYESAPTFNAAMGTITVAPNCYAVVGSRSLTSTDDMQDDFSGNLATAIVSGGKGAITITAAPEGLEIFNLAGQTVYSTSADISGTSVTLPAGIYIVRSGREVDKVIVR